MLNPNHGNCFAKIGQAAFNPVHFVPGIGPSPDKMSQGRLFFLPNDTHCCRLGAHHAVLASQPTPRDASRTTTAAATRCVPTAMLEELRGLNSFGGPQ